MEIWAMIRLNKGDIFYVSFVEEKLDTKSVSR